MYENESVNVVIFLIVIFHFCLQRRGQISYFFQPNFFFKRSLDEDATMRILKSEKWDCRWAEKDFQKAGNRPSSQLRN